MRLSAQIRATVVAVASGAALGSGSTVSAAEAPRCEVTTIAELPVRFEHNRPLVQVLINGRPNWFILDTGAALSTITSVAAQENGLSEHTVQWLRFSGVGGDQQGKSTVVQELAFGSFKIKNGQLLTTGGGRGMDAAGLLGRDYLGQSDLELDLAHNVVRFLAPKHCGTQSEAYWTDHSIEAELAHDEATTPFFVSMQINGRPFRAMVDTGAQTSVITTYAAHDVGVSDRELTGAVEYAKGIGEQTVSYRIGVFDKIAIGGEQIGHAKLQVADLFQHNRQISTGSMLAKHEVERDEPGMILGADYLRSHRVLLSNSQKVFYATYYGGPIFQTVGSGVSASPAQPSASGPAGATAASGVPTP